MMVPRTATKIFTGKAGDAALFVELAVDEVAWEAIEGAIDVVAVAVLAGPSPCCVEDFETNAAVAFAQQFSLAWNMHRTSSSFPPEITTSPLGSWAIE
jgi:hypothetical protein